MNRPLVFLLSLLLVAYLAALGWTGYQWGSSYSGHPLTLDLQEPLAVALQETALLELSGQGFSEETRVFMHMDVNNQEAIIGELPLLNIGHDVELVGDSLLVGTNSVGVRQFDVGDPAKPKMKNIEWLSNATVLEINRHEDKLYLSCGKHGVQIFTIRENGRFMDMQRLNTWTVAVASRVVGNHLYVAANTDGLLVYDLRKLEQKRPIAIIDPGGPVRGLATYGQYLYAATGKAGVSIYDLGENGLPLPVGRLQHGHTARGVKVVGNYLYLLESGGIKQYSLTVPDSPKLVAERYYLDAPTALHFFGEEIFVLDNTHGLGRIVNDGELLGDSVEFLNLSSNPMAMIPVGPYLYVVGSNRQILIVDPKKIQPRQTIARLPTPVAASDFLIVEDCLYFVGAQGVFFYDLSDPASKYQMLSRGKFFRIKHQAGRLYIGGDRGGIEVYDISQQGSPRKVAAWPELESNSLEVAGDRLYVAGNGDKIHLYELSDSPEVVALDQIQEGDVRRILSEKGLIAVTLGKEGVKFYREDNGKLSFVSQLKLPFPLAGFSEATDLQKVGNTLYVANGYAGLLIIDITTPEQPMLLSSLKLPGFSGGLLLEGDRVYVASRFSGLHTVDISKRDAPKLVDTIKMPEIYNRVRAHNDMLYVNSGRLGIEVVPKPIELKAKVISDNRLKVELPELNKPGRYNLHVSNNFKADTLSSVLRYQ